MKKEIPFIVLSFLLLASPIFAGDAKLALDGPEGGTSGKADNIASLEDGDLIVCSTNDDARYGDAIFFYVNDINSDEGEIQPHTIDPVDGGTEDLELANVYTGRIFGTPDVVEITGNTTITQCEDILGVTYFFTAAAVLTLPDIATCQNKGKIRVYVQDASETASVEAGANDDIKLNGTWIGPGEQIDSSGAAGDFVELEVLDAAGWYVGPSDGPWTDGG